MKFAASVGATSLAALRAIDHRSRFWKRRRSPASARFPSDHRRLLLSRKRRVAIFAAGEQAHVPLLVGWNTEENGARSVLGQRTPTPENFAKAVAHACTATTPTRC